MTAERTDNSRRLMGAIARSLATVESGDAPYRRVLEAFAQAVGADAAYAVRSSEESGFAVDEYLPERAFDESEAAAATEWERRLALLRAAFSVDPDNTGAAAREAIRNERWAIVGSIGGRSDDAPGYQVALAAKSDAFPAGCAALVDAGLEVVEPILKTRIEISRRENERRRAERELRTSEEELRNFFEASKDMIYTSNAEDRIASINNAGLALLGLRNRFDAVGRVFGAFAYNPEDRAHFLARIKEHGFVRDYEIVVKRAGAEPIFCLETATAVKRPDGTLVAIQGIVKDISDRINNEKALWHANLELAETNERLRETQIVLVQQEKLASIGQLAAGIAHEINNPLGFLKSNYASFKEYFASLRDALEKAKAALPPERYAEIESAHDLEFIFSEFPQIFAESDDGYSRIIEIVSQLKSFSRIDAEAKRAPYDLERGIESTLVVVGNELKYVADVKRDFAGVQPVEAEGGAINQVLLNIMVNAAQAMASMQRKERGLLTVGTREDEDNVYCSISDNGPGMPPEVRQRVFDPFFTTKEPGKGTGLGLSISYDIIVNKHGGKISVRSEPGAGAAFEISIPKKPLPQE
jgi:PAS domain S-box-containing protein